MFPSFSGDGPPAMIMIGHPVCCMIESPKVASVRRSLVITLDEQCESPFLQDMSVKITYDWNPRFLASSDSFGTRLSLRANRYSSQCVFISSVSLLFFFHKLDHNLEPFLWRLLVWVLHLPLRLVLLPFFINMRFPLAVICQHVICLPTLKQLRL